MVELIIVIAIMAILIGVLAPQYIKYVEKSRVSSDEDIADALLDASYTMVADENIYSSISNGSVIEFANGISTDNTGVAAGLAEYFGSGYSGKSVKSKSYRGKTYVVYFSTNAKGDFVVTDSWR